MKKTMLITGSSSGIGYECADKFKDQYQIIGVSKTPGPYVIELGDLKLKVFGDETFKIFNVDASIINEDEETFLTTGTVDIVNNQTVLNLEAVFENFSIKPIGGFLKGILNNVRGLAKGKINIVGSLDNPEVDGVLYLNNAGIQVPYLNVDYDFDKDSKIDLTQEKFIFRDIDIIDVNESYNIYIQEKICNGTFNFIRFYHYFFSGIIEI